MNIQITVYYPPKDKAPKINVVTRAQAAKQAQDTPSKDTSDTSVPFPDTPHTPPPNDRKRFRVFARLGTKASLLYNVSQHPDMSFANFQHCQQQDPVVKRLYDFLKFGLLRKQDKEACILVLHKSQYIILENLVYHIYVT